MKLKLIAIFILLIINSIIIEKFISNQYQIPALRIPEALIVKKLQRMALDGGDSFYLSRSSLSENGLKLSHWHGNQEIRFHNEKKIAKVIYNLNWSTDSNLYLYWNYQSHHLDGLRIENGKKVTRYSEKNGSVERIDVSRINGLPKIIEVELRQVGDDVEVRLQGQKYILKNNSLGGTWGIRGDESDIEIKEINVTFTDSSSYHQDFKINFSIKKFVSILLLLSLFCFLAIFITLNKLIYLKYIVLVFMVTIYFTDTKLMSVQQIESFTDSLKLKKDKTLWDDIEIYRKSIFYPPRVINELREFTYRVYPRDRIFGGAVSCIRKNKCIYTSVLAKHKDLNDTRIQNRIMLVGTSQSIGAGASDIDRTFFSLLHEKLNSKQEIISVNISQSALTPEEMFIKYKESVESYRPTLVIVNLGYNLADYSFPKALADFLDHTKRNKIKLVLMREANNLKLISDYLNEVDRFAKENSLPIIDLYGYLRSAPINEDLGIWWDPVHFNDRGHSLAAQFIFEELIRQKLI